MSSNQSSEYISSGNSESKLIIFTRGLFFILHSLNKYINNFFHSTQPIQRPTTINTNTFTNYHNYTKTITIALWKKDPRVPNHWYDRESLRIQGKLLYLEANWEISRFHLWGSFFVIFYKKKSERTLRITMVQSSPWVKHVLDLVSSTWRWCWFFFFFKKYFPRFFLFSSLRFYPF